MPKKRNTQKRNTQKRNTAKQLTCVMCKVQVMENDPRSNSLFLNTLCYCLATKFLKLKPKRVENNLDRYGNPENWPQVKMCRVCQKQLAMMSLMSSFPSNVETLDAQEVLNYFTDLNKYLTDMCEISDIPILNDGQFTSPSTALSSTTHVDAKRFGKQLVSIILSKFNSSDRDLCSNSNQDNQMMSDDTSPPEVTPCDNNAIALIPPHLPPVIIPELPNELELPLQGVSRIPNPDPVPSLPSSSSSMNQIAMITDEHIQSNTTTDYNNDQSINSSSNNDTPKILVESSVQADLSLNRGTQMLSDDEDMIPPKRRVITPTRSKPKDTTANSIASASSAPPTRRTTSTQATQDKPDHEGSSSASSSSCNKSCCNHQSSKGCSNNNSSQPTVVINIQSGSQVSQQLDRTSGLNCNHHHHHHPSVSSGHHHHGPNHCQSEHIPKIGYQKEKTVNRQQQALPYRHCNERIQGVRQRNCGGSQLETIRQSNRCYVNQNRSFVPHSNQVNQSQQNYPTTQQQQGPSAFLQSLPSPPQPRPPLSDSYALIPYQPSGSQAARSQGPLPITYPPAPASSSYIPGNPNDHQASTSTAVAIHYPEHHETSTQNVSDFLHVTNCSGTTSTCCDPDSHERVNLCQEFSRWNGNTENPHTGTANRTTPSGSGMRLESGCHRSNQAANPTVNSSSSRGNNSNNDGRTSVTLNTPNSIEALKDRTPASTQPNRSTPRPDSSSSENIIQSLWHGDADDEDEGRSQCRVDGRTSSMEELSPITVSPEGVSRTPLIQTRSEPESRTDSRNNSGGRDSSTLSNSRPLPPPPLLNDDSSNQSESVGAYNRNSNENTGTSRDEDVRAAGSTSSGTSSKPERF